MAADDVVTGAAAASGGLIVEAQFEQPKPSRGAKRFTAIFIGFFAFCLFQ
jgi:hypothetical protein